MLVNAGSNTESQSAPCRSAMRHSALWLGCFNVLGIMPLKCRCRPEKICGHPCDGSGRARRHTVQYCCTAATSTPHDGQYHGCVDRSKLLDMLNLYVSYPTKEKDREYNTNPSPHSPSLHCNTTYQSHFLSKNQNELVINFSLFVLLFLHFKNLLVAHLSCWIVLQKVVDPSLKIVAVDVVTNHAPSLYSMEIRN
jgi:hypothetical protein